VFREGVTAHRSTLNGGATRIGNGVYLMAASHIGHDAHIGDGVTLANSALLGGYVTVGHNAFISGNGAVHQHVQIGAYAMISATSFIVQDIPPWTIAQGTPGRVAGLNVVGLRRNGFSPERRQEIKKLFRMLYRSDMPFEEVKKNIHEIESDDARLLSQFLHATKRGIAAFRTRGLAQYDAEADAE